MSSTIAAGFGGFEIAPTKLGLNLPEGHALGDLDSVTWNQVAKLNLV